MEPGHEVETPTTDSPTPPPICVDGLGGALSPPPPAPPPTGPSEPPAEPATLPQPQSPPLPTPETVLRAIAAAGGAWFPSRDAAALGLARDQLDEPLAELRLAGLIRVAEWVKGLGQGYVLTSEGRFAVANPAALEQLKGSPGAGPPAPADPTADPTADPPAAEVPLGDSLSEAELTLRPPIVVPILLMANALWFFVCVVNGIRWGLTLSRSLSEGHPDVLHRFGAVAGADLLNGEWWRLLTACFVHIGVLHLIGNLFALAMMGPLAELLWGRLRLLLIYFISGLCGSALAMTLRPDSLLAGASGAIWGIQMSLFAWLFAFRQHLPPDLASDWFRRLSVVFVLNAAVSFLPGVSWEGHLGGGLAGFVVAGLLNAVRFGDQRRRVAAWALIGLLPVAAVAGLALAMDAKGMPGWQHLRQRLWQRQEAERQLHQALDRAKQLEEIQAEYNSQVAPRLPLLEPGAVEQPEAEARELAKMTDRPPEQLKAVRAKLESLKAAADAVVQSASREPTGAATLDQHFERARAFAAARSRSFELLLAMLAAPEPPKPAAWEAWRAARRDADRLWAEIQPPKSQPK